MMSCLISILLFYNSSSSTKSPSFFVSSVFFFPKRLPENALPVYSCPTSFDPSSELFSQSFLDSCPPLSVASPIVSSPTFFFPLANSPIHFTYQCLYPTEPPSLLVISNVSPIINPAPKVPSHTYSLHYRSTLQPLSITLLLVLPFQISLSRIHIGKWFGYLSGRLPW